MLARQANASTTSKWRLPVRRSKHFLLRVADKDASLKLSPPQTLEVSVFTSVRSVVTVESDVFFALLNQGR